jgi:hypothetical protein
MEWVVGLRAYQDSPNQGTSCLNAELWRNKLIIANGFFLPIKGMSQIILATSNLNLTQLIAVE